MRRMIKDFVDMHTSIRAMSSMTIHTEAESDVHDDE